MRNEPRAAEKAARSLAAWLAPYISEELGLGPGRPGKATDEDQDSAFDDDTCREYVRGLGDKVLINGHAFFEALDRKRRIGSVEAAAIVGVSTPRNLPSVLTTPLKRRARAVGVPLPWRVESDYEDRTVWIATGDVPSRLVKAITDELDRRQSKELS